MIEVFPNLFVGAAPDLMYAAGPGGADSGNVAPGWFIISAAKEPWHREALGYKERGAPKDHHEYLVASRPGRLILNLVDVEDPAYIRDEIVTTAIAKIDEALDAGDKVLLHCNQGHSRAPSLALLWMRWGEKSPLGPFLAKLTPDEAMTAFGVRYPTYAPAGGMAGFIRNHWEQI